MNGNLNNVVGRWDIMCELNDASWPRVLHLFVTQHGPTSSFDLVLAEQPGLHHMRLNAVCCTVQVYTKTHARRTIALHHEEVS